VAKPQIGDELSVLRQIGSPDVVQKPPALTDHLQEAAAGMVILVVLPKVPRQVVDPRRQKRDLDPGGTPVTLVELVLLNDFFAIERHVNLFASSRVYAT